MVAAKKLTDYKKQDEETVNLAGRIPVSKRKLLDEKMAKDGFKGAQDWLNAAVDRYLGEG